MLIGAGCAVKKDKSILLSDIPFGNIYDDFGAPRTNTSYHFNPININGKTFEKGLGIHAPSRLSINLKGKAVLLEASIGLDRESTRYRKGKGSVIFAVIADGDTVLNSDVFYEDTPAQRIEIDLKGVKQLTLVCDTTKDGYIADFAAWADARLIVHGNCDAGDFQISHYREAVLVNHSGYLPESPKYCTVHTNQKEKFEVINYETDKLIFSGVLEPHNFDTGIWSKGDFSELNEEGRYFIRVGGLVSQVFEISQSLYSRDIEKHLNFIMAQRSGDPDHGRSKGQHMDDGIRPDTGELIDAVGGWYDAADLRKATFIDIINLYSLAEIYGSEKISNLNEAILDEIKWGNALFLKLQDKSGYMMYSIGFNGVGQANPGKKQRNYNTYTDNIRGTWDDRPIQIDPSMIVAQMVFVVAELEVAKIFDSINSSYANECRNAAIRCFKWSQENQKCIVSYDYGAGISAAIKLFEATSDSLYFNVAKAYVLKLLSLQEKENQPVNGWFNTWHDNPELAVPLNYLNWQLFGLYDFVKAFPNHLLVPEVKSAIQFYSENYLLKIASMNPFNLLPYGVFMQDEGGNRKIGDYYFRYGVQNNYDKEWWNGINSVIAAQGYGLALAAEILDKPQYIAVAQSQLDWIYGCNPFDASTVTGIGYNQPDWFKTIEFFPPVPKITGAVMAGIGTDQMDRFVLDPGSWHTAEYWLPPTAYLMLLLDALNHVSQN
ncbi:MAG: hypothetical protein A2W90_15380 [Bacteroidetes bacterium GWF2_42_66]|nr:MAG: hypothetical protein A2W92_07160 [Bacteroidetes bacterium GWA2_42_15]OFX96875.1 MAG: hypothetical protein A2W89_19875 [Bacteroidetes bacterium GWE2_42_39]OFY46870.1 MAG: hypothetical protein A2W90_15380 [Bacteroidetes bacterium GWF2_42_66]